MSQSSILPINEERPFEPQELFFSLTDTKGIIRYGNQVFTRVSGYTESELIGKPHNIIRHPDMPRAVFKLLWDYLEDGKSIAAYVKNMAKDGRYYWVLATVMPVPGGYLSIRLKPSSPLFQAVEQAYVDTLKVEQAYEKETGNRKQAMQVSLEYLSKRLQEAGFENYDHFMSEALAQELGARKQWMEQSGVANQIKQPQGALASLQNIGMEIETKLCSLFSSVGDFKRLATELANKYELIQELGPSLQFLALNARMAASRLGDQGIVQASVADALGAKRKQAEQTIGGLVRDMQPLRDLTASQAFDIAVARFEAEMATLFIGELSFAPEGVHGSRVRESLDLVVGELETRSAAVIQGMSRLDDSTREAEQQVLDLKTRIAEMKAIQLNGKIEAAASAGRSDFSVIFEEASKHIEGGRADCEVLLDVLETSSERIAEFREMKAELELDLSNLHAARQTAFQASEQMATAC